MNNTVTKAHAKKRINYGFKLDFPQNPFTLRQFRRQRHDVSYITAYKRIEKALREGILTTVEGAKVSPAKSKRGRPQKVYSLAHQEAVANQPEMA